MLAPFTITGPLHAHGVRTAEEYRAYQAHHIRQLQAARPVGPWGDPHAVTDPIVAVISGGRWVVICVCGNAPSASPEWRLACCCECGRIYEAVSFPENREAIEAVLLLRPVSRTRNWVPSETVADLEHENVAHGHGVPA